MPEKSTSHIKNEYQYEALREKGMSKEIAARIANTPDAGIARPIRAFDHPCHLFICALSLGDPYDPGYADLISYNNRCP